jgi:hypothetical protein
MISKYYDIINPYILKSFFKSLKSICDSYIKIKKHNYFRKDIKKFVTMKKKNNGRGD